MRLRALRLLRFGSFSDLELDFAAGGRTFQVIYGDNETGKSTALRAISGLLYGIPERTPDAHLHRAKDLRIGAELETDAGRRLRIVRRKGRKDTLLGSDGSPIPEARLEPYLGGVSRELFEAIFGLDHERLVAGGRELLAGRGELGEALFGAASGLRGLHQLVDTLQQEAAELFKPTGQVPRLNRALARHREARARVGKLALKPGEWERIARERDEASAELEQVRARHARAKSQLEERRMLEAALPDLRGRAAILARREELGGVVILADDASERRRDAEAALAAANRREQKLDDERQRLEAALASLRVPEGLLALESRAADLGDRRAVHVKAATDRQQLLSKLDAGSAEIEALLRELPRSSPDERDLDGRSLDELESLRLDVASQARIRELAREGEGCRARSRALRGNAAAASQRAREAQAGLDALPPVPDAGALRSAAAAASREGDLEGRRRSLAAELAAKQERAALEADALPLRAGPPEVLVALPLPTDETVDRFERETSQLKEERRTLDDRRRSVRDQLGELHEARAALESGGRIPAREDLEAARRHRDGLWDRVRRAWLEGATDPSAPEVLAGDYLDSIVRADDLGDRMFAEHERVARIAALRDGQRRAEESAASVERELSALGRREAELSEGWSSAWAPSGIEPLPPREMRGWKLKHGKLLDLTREIGDLRERIDALESAIDAHRSACRSALAELGEPVPDPGQSLTAVLETAERVIGALDRSGRERSRLADAAAAATREAERCALDLAAAERELGEWQGRWKAAIAPLDLPDTAEPPEAEAVLEKLVQIFAKHARLEALRERIRHIDEDGAAFVWALEQLVCEGGRDLPDLAPGSPAERSAELLARIREGRDQRARRDAMRDRLEEIEIELQEVARERRAASSEIEALLERAAVSSPDELELAEQRSAERRELDRRLVEIEERLRRTGRPLEELVARGAEVQEEGLDLEIERLERAVEASERQRDEHNQRLASLERDFQAMDGGAGAAEAAEEAEEALAEISQLAQDYAQRCIAAVLLGREIQRFAEENQGPILKRASEIFRRITLERYRDINSGFSDDDEAVLQCRRMGGETIGVEGLSDGTRDQLYLSLRLAALEHHMARSEAMPLIVDDVLVTFDDPRSAATLELMGELAARSQILFFTHHGRLVELARQAIPADRLRVHELRAS